jgi:hypothetical protein
MTDEHWEVVDRVAGQIQAEIMRGLLEAQGIRVWMNQEGAGHAYGITVGPMGTVEIMVPSNALEQARQVLEAYYSGAFDNEELPDIPGEPEDEEGTEIA